MAREEMASKLSSFRAAIGSECREEGREECLCRDRQGAGGGGVIKECQVGAEHSVESKKKDCLLPNERWLKWSYIELLRNLNTRLLALIM